MQKLVPFPLAFCNLLLRMLARPPLPFCTAAPVPLHTTRSGDRPMSSIGAACCQQLFHSHHRAPCIFLLSTVEASGRKDLTFEFTFPFTGDGWVRLVFHLHGSTPIRGVEAGICEPCIIKHLL
jgi:hypothetical protein